MVPLGARLQQANEASRAKVPAWQGPSGIGLRAQKLQALSRSLAWAGMPHERGGEASLLDREGALSRFGDEEPVPWCPAMPLAGKVAASQATRDKWPRVGRGPIDLALLWRGFIAEV